MKIFFLEKEKAKKSKLFKKCIEINFSLELDYNVVDRKKVMSSQLLV